MSLDGLRAWIGIVERKLTMRTRVFLVLVAIAVGGAAAGIYLGIQAQSNQVSESDVQALQTELTARIEALETRLGSLEASEVPVPSPEPEVKEKGSGATKP
jgi:uncharacterized protein HemX